MVINDETIEAALLDADVAPDIIFAAQASLLARGVTDAAEVAPTLISAAWCCHKELYGAGSVAEFARLLRRHADAIDNASVMN